MQKGDKQWNETKQKDHKQIKRKERIKGNKRKKRTIYDKVDAIYHILWKKKTA